MKPIAKASGIMRLNTKDKRRRESMENIKKEIERIEKQYTGVKVEIKPTYVLKVVPKYSDSGRVYERRFTSLEALEEHLNDQENFLI